MDGCRRRRRRRGRRRPVLERRREGMAEVRLTDGDDVLLIRVVETADDARILLDALPAVGVPSVLPMLPLLLPRPLLAVSVGPPFLPLPLDELADVRMRHRGRRPRPGRPPLMQALPPLLLPPSRRIQLVFRPGGGGGGGGWRVRRRSRSGRHRQGGDGGAVRQEGRASGDFHALVPDLYVVRRYDSILRYQSIATHSPGGDEVVRQSTISRQA